MTFVVPATGKRYLRLAEALRSSAQQHGWSGEFLLLTENGLDSFGRDTKTGFGQFLPDDTEGPVVLMDADMLATGTLDVNPVPGTVSAIWMSDRTWFDSFFTVFPTAKLAKEFSEQWNTRWRKTWNQMHKDKNRACNDAFSFNITMAAFPQHRLSLTNRLRPFPWLKHLILEKRQIS
jgi:hypothetical protein